MTTVKARKVGNSVAVTIPKSLNIEEGTEFSVYKGIDDAIVLAPKIDHLKKTVTNVWQSFLWSIHHFSKFFNHHRGYV
ncbi:type II toxin-antitoxin system PemI/MazE family antitoxin [Streptococcus macacae]|uniref:SpoVT/AbrB-like protein n=1 Tax=Streptococcus macacae NCTC 11558 TaxID=764298 RepID=G5JYY0_9STRE|nr:AbrB/MazE/SpoVT family DNA-binding domain-containing protein [Streptococcus macacae]EHJ52007.1 SpoVT/AbrB-like protein [Streptococcus macacae NCTC 11558]SUN77191.1 transcriptional regulator, AbrB family [Streptococcus macacae NCTC 11558]SUN78236.1 transcriptional regulator, AbrB family [Streptococcus macacae NCTC 11558]